MVLFGGGSVLTSSAGLAARAAVPAPHPALLPAGLCVFPRRASWGRLHGPNWVQARDLEQSNSAEDEYMISDFDLPVTKFVSVPREMGHLNCNAFVAGVVRGVLDGAGFPARCVGAARWVLRAHTVQACMWDARLLLDVTAAARRPSPTHAILRSWGC